MTFKQPVLYQMLKEKFRTDTAIADALGVARPAVHTWRKHIPERIALLCHLSPDIPYVYNPADYGRDPNRLGLALTKPSQQ
ncbi:hypothetical protein PMPD1_2494 [Paramixta manurensis]|uniref:Helix-turn-helix domain-containing protein n=1 Tax=Paramixta manurensis TaxID=2740817 RepID=A0A6M8U9L5_9GAMM|nr:hypothetical protein PMPD1_2494 [Erwiniaceae bacterium PD-1]